MKEKKGFLFLFLLAASFHAFEASERSKRQLSALQGMASQHIQFPYEAVGCFRDAVTKPRPFPDMIANLRAEIDLTNPNKTVATCAAKSYLAQFQYFGIEYMGECWSGLEGETTHNKFGPSSECQDGLGGDESLFVYRFLEPPKPVAASLKGLKCFPSEATVQLKSGQRVTMSQVKLGDHVRTLDAESGITIYTEVIGFLHRIPTGINRFLRLDLKQGNHITLSSEHLIYLKSSDGLSQQAVLAKHVAVGQEVVTSGGVVTSVMNITTVDGYGLYAPLTMSGDVLVDDVLVSCYAHVKSHTLAHNVMLPYRLTQRFLKATTSVLPLHSDTFLDTFLTFYSNVLLYIANFAPLQRHILSSPSIINF